MINSNRQLPRLSGSDTPDAPPTSYPMDLPSVGQGEGGGAGMSMTQISSIVRSYWRQSAMAFLGLTLVSVVAIKFLPKTYTAVTTLIIDTKNKNPLGGNGEFQIGLLANFASTQAQLISSAPVLQEVVDRLHLTEDHEFTDGFRGDPSGLREYAQHVLANDITVDQGTGGQLLYVTAAAREPDRAAQLSNAVADVYLEQLKKRDTEPASERAQRYREQLNELKANVNAAQEKLDEFRKQKGVTDLARPNTGDDDNGDSDSGGDSASQAQMQLQQNYLEAHATVLSLEAKIASGGGSNSPEAQASPLIQTLRQKLHELQSELTQMSTTYGPQHPKVIDLKSQIASTQHALAAEEGTIGSGLQAQLQQARTLENKYQAALEKQKQDILKLRDVQGEGAKLQTELDSANRVYKKALDGYQQINFDKDSPSDVSLVSRATSPIKPTKPNKIKLALMGAFASALLGLGIPFLYELLLNRRIRCRDDLERSFGLPVLAQFDAVTATGEA